MKVQRGICKECGANIAVRKDGVLRDHQDRRGRPTVQTASGAKTYPFCRGSGYPPISSEPEAASV